MADRNVTTVFGMAVSIFFICAAFAAVPVDAAGLVLRDTPCRLFDSRNIGTGSKITSATIETWGSPGTSQGGEAGCGVPYGSSGVLLNLTVFDPNSAGFVRLWRFGSTQPLSTALSFSSGQLDECAGLTVGVGIQNGKMSLNSPFLGAHFILDLAGWIDGGGGGSEGLPAPRHLRFLSTTNAPVTGLSGGDRLLVLNPTANPFIGHDNEFATWKGIPSCDPTTAACWSFEMPSDGDFAYEASTALYWRFRLLSFESWDIVGP